jgi:carbon storage regulator
MRTEAQAMGMLVLSRQRDEVIRIGDDIEVTVVDIRGEKVRIGIRAPKDLPVDREEVYLAKRRDARAAAQVKPDELPPGQPGRGVVKGGQQA